MASIGKPLFVLLLSALLKLPAQGQTLPFRQTGTAGPLRKATAPFSPLKYGEDHPPVFFFGGLNWCGATTPELGAHISILRGRLPSEPVANARYDVLNLQFSGMLAIADQGVPGVRAAAFYAPQSAHFLTVGMHADYFFHRDMEGIALYPEAGFLIRTYAFKHYLETWKMPVIRLAYGYNVIPGEMPPGINKHMVTLQVTTIGTINRTKVYKKG